MQDIVFVNTELGYDCGGSGRHWLLWPWEITPMVSTIITCQRYGDVKTNLCFLFAHMWAAAETTTTTTKTITFSRVTHRLPKNSLSSYHYQLDFHLVARY